MPGDIPPLSSEEMLRLAREGLAQPAEATGPMEAAPAPMVAAPVRPVVRAPRIRRIPPIPNVPTPRRLVIAVAVFIAVIAAGVAIFIATASSVP